MNVLGMEKRYQVFVSSTYEDLIEERLEVMKALLELNCIPCGMEYFPAANEDQWTFIKNLIDTCDYYVVIIAGRYGSTDSQGTSYTQKEYEYAMSREIPTIGFIHRDRDSLPPDKKQEEDEKTAKLDEFIGLVRDKICKDRSNAYELGGVVSRSLIQLINRSPGTGWVRADRVASSELLEEINDLRKDNQAMREKIGRLEGDSLSGIITANLAYQESVIIRGKYKVNDIRKVFQHKCSWKRLFGMISPYLLNPLNDLLVSNQLASCVLREIGVKDFGHHSLDESVSGILCKRPVHVI